MPGVVVIPIFSWGKYALIPLLLVPIIAYLLGCSNGAVIVSKYILKDDVRKHGSGNAGLTNFHRTFGGKLTLVVILSDVMKAVLAMTIASQLYYAIGGVPGDLADTHVRYWAGIWCLLGHMFPVMFQFKGGKGILSGGTIVWMIDWRIALVVWGGFLLFAVLTRYVSLGSCWAAASFPVASWFVYHDALVLLMAIFLGGLILWMHRGNIVRLATGKESKFTLKKSSAKPEEDKK